jgi:hypothetical protein
MKASRTILSISVSAFVLRLFIGLGLVSARKHKRLLSFSPFPVSAQRCKSARRAQGPMP